MNERTINKGLLVAGSLLGIGILSYILFRSNDKEVVEDAEFTIIEPPKKTSIPKPDKIKKKQTVPKNEENERKRIVSEEKKEIIEKTEVLPEPNDDFPLKLGSKGKRVEQLRVYLLKNHGVAGLITDEFETITKERVERFLKVKQVSEKLFLDRDMDNSKKKKNHARKAKH